MQKTKLALLFVSIMSLAGTDASAKEYTLTADDFEKIFAKYRTDFDPHVEYLESYTKDDLQWSIKFYRDDPYYSIVPNFAQQNLSSYYIFDEYNAARINYVEISAQFPKNEAPVLILYNMGPYDINFSANESGRKLYTNITYLDKTNISSSETYEYYTKTYGYENNTEVSIENGEIGGGLLTISFEWDIPSDFMFKEIKINTIPTIAPAETPVRLTALRVGQPIFLEAEEGAMVYYKIDEATDYEKYQAKMGISFSEPGNHTLSYYAEKEGKTPSEIVEEEFDVVANNGISSALLANSGLTVSGKIVRQESTYTLIADEDDLIDEYSAAPDEDELITLAIENSDYPKLKAAPIGAQVIISGRPTDRFDQAGMGSLSMVSINGEQTTKVTTVNAAPAAKASQAYDLQGRPITGQTATPRIQIQSGRKILTR